MYKKNCCSGFWVRGDVLVLIGDFFRNCVLGIIILGYFKNFHVFQVFQVLQDSLIAKIAKRIKCLAFMIQLSRTFTFI